MAVGLTTAADLGIQGPEKRDPRRRGKRYWHLNLFPHERVLKARVPRAKLPDGSERPVEPLKAVTQLVHAHRESIVARAQSRIRTAFS